mgnify:CR=1 FL=1
MGVLESGNSTISKYDYTVNSRDQRTHVVKTGSAFAANAFHAWGYDSKGQVTSANKYLGTLLQEAAKDHYPHLKAAVLRLVRRTTGRDRELTLKVLSSSPAKVSGADPATFTVWVALNGSRRAVFRFDHQIQPEDLALATDSLFRLLEAHAGGGETDFLSKAPTFSESSWAPVICRFDAELGRWQAWTIDRQGNTTPVSDNAT